MKQTKNEGQTLVPMQSWYLEFVEGSSSKFYRVHLSQDGLVTTGWGRIGTYGSSSVQRLPYNDAKAIALRQVYAKAAKGYTIKVDDFKWEVAVGTLTATVGSNSADLLNSTYEQARQNPIYAGDRAVVARLYDTFITRAEECMTAAKEKGFEAALPEFNELQKAFEGIEEMHGRAATTMALTNQMLMSSLLGTT